MNLERLYRRLPVAMQNLAASLEGWRVQRTRYGGDFRRLLAGYVGRTFASPAETAAYRQARLQAFLRHAATTVPYYRDLFRQARLAAEDFRGPEDLARLPLLTKAQVQEAPDRFRSEAVPASACLVCHTSGTTGAGLRFGVTWQAHREQWAVWWRYRGWHGIEPTTPCGYFGGRSVVPVGQERPPYWRYNRAGRQVLFSGYHLGPATAAAYVGEINRARVPWLHGYPSQLAKLAALALEQGLVITGVRWVTTGAENLLPQQATLIERAFGVAPVEHYGMAEGAANVSMCPLRRLHVDEDFAWVEFLPSAAGAGAHTIVGTNFTNWATPLVRYEIGDTARLEPEAVPCPCGRPGRTVAAVDGRLEDFVVTRRGAFLGRLDHIFKDQVRIREAQIRQDVPGRMTILVVKGPAYGAGDEQALRAETFERVGVDVDFDIAYVDRIPRTPAGKLRFVVSSAKLCDRPESA